MVAKVRWEHEQLQAENKQLKRKFELQRHHLFKEQQEVKSLKKENKIMASRLKNNPSSYTQLLKEEKHEFELKLELKYADKYEKYRQGL